MFNFERVKRESRLIIKGYISEAIVIVQLICFFQPKSQILVPLLVGPLQLLDRMCFDILLVILNTVDLFFIVQMNRKKKLFVSNISTMITRFQNFLNYYLALFFKCIVLYNLALCFPAWSAVCYIPNFYMQVCVYMYLVPILLHHVGNS